MSQVVDNKAAVVPEEEAPPNNNGDDAGTGGGVAAGGAKKKKLALDHDLPAEIPPIEMSAEEQEVMENEVMEFLPTCEAAELDHLIEMLAIHCPEVAKGKKNSLLKVLLTHLLEIGGEEDGGVGTFRVVHKFLMKDDEIDSQNLKSEHSSKPSSRSSKVSNAGSKASVKSEPESVTRVREWQKKNQKLLQENLRKSLQRNSQPAKKSAAAALIDVYKLKDLKINGIIGGKVAKDNMTYTSLIYQISNAKKQGCSEEKIHAAVVKQIASTCPLKNLFEIKTNQTTLDSLQDTLRAYCQQKDSATTMVELGQAKQKGDESCLDFVARVMFLRESVMDLSIEEGCPQSRKYLNRRFHQTLFSGIKNQNIRAELRENIKVDSTLGDPEILQLVSAAVMSETERKDKFDTAGTPVDVDAVDADVQRTGNEELNKKLKEMEKSHKKDMTALRADVNVIKSAVMNNNNPGGGEDNGDNGGNDNGNGRGNGQGNGRGNGGNRGARNGGRNNRNFRRGRCQQCVEQNRFRCTHCLHCFSTEHRRAECPTYPGNQNNDNLND